MSCVRMMLAVGAMIFAVGCGKSPEQICNDGINKGCAQQVACGFTTQTACVTAAKALTDCSRAGQAQCQTGTTYDAAQAQKCSDDYGNLACSDIAAGNFPASCTTVCH